MTTCQNPEECCRALSRVWDALGPQSAYAGKDIAEHVSDLRIAHDALKAALQAILQVEHIDGVDGGRIRYEFDFRSPLAQQVRDALKLAEKKL